MKVLSAILGIGVVAGIGYFIGKKVMAKNADKVNKDDDEGKVYADYNEESDDCVCNSKVSNGESGDKCSCGKNKLRKASMFAVGAIKTSADKIAEGVKDIVNEDMVKKGEETTENIKKEIDNLKNLNVSINISSEPDNDKSDDIVEAVGETVAEDIDNTNKFFDVEDDKDSDKVEPANATSDSNNDEFEQI